MSTKITQRNVTRNQSTVDFTNSCLFTFDNRFIEADFTAAADVTITDGQLVVKDTTSPTKVKLATSATLADVIGVLKVGGSVALTNGETIPVMVGTKGSVDSTLLVLPATVTLNTVVGNKILKDVLEDVGLHLEKYTENSFTDN